MSGNLDHQVWLRAAVIAVPVCGLLILIVLIYVARKLLNGEEEVKETSTNSMKSKCLYSSPERSQTEVLLPIMDG